MPASHTTCQLLTVNPDRTTLRLDPTPGAARTTQPRHRRTTMRIPQALLAVLAALAGCTSTPPEQAESPTPAELSAGEEAQALDGAIAGPTESLSPGAITEPPAAEGLLAQEGIPHHDPKFRDHYEEAVLMLGEDRAPEAVDALRMAIFDAPDSAVSWLLLGETYARLGRGQQARACVDEALSYDPDLPGARAFLARWWLDRGEPARARRHAERFSRLAPEDPVSSHLLARTYMGLQMWDEAIAACRRTIARDPQFVHAYNNLGFAALQLGRNELALQYLEAATELDGVQPFMLNNLGLAYERLARHTDALQAYADAVTMDPSYTTAVANRDRMRVVVDREVADEVARILAGHARSAERPDASASAGGVPLQAP